jgi:hypothetical protein
MDVKEPTLVVRSDRRMKVEAGANVSSFERGRGMLHFSLVCTSRWQVGARHET